MRCDLKTPLLALLLVLATGCATYQSRVQSARNDLYQGRFEKAAEALEPLALKSGSDQLVYLLDWGVSLYLSGQHRESIEALTAADQLVDFNDYLSLSHETASLLMGQEMVQYKGTSYEKLLINVYLALNFLKLNEFESAAVEIRRLRLRLGQLAERGEKDYHRSFLASYLSGLVWEMAGEWDSSVIDYEAAFKINPDVQVLKQDLLNANYRARRRERLRQLEALFAAKVDPATLREKGQVVFLIDQGWIPRLRMSSANFRVPELYSVPSQVERVQMFLTPQGEKEGEPPSYTQQSEVIFDLEHMAHQYHADIMGPLILKRLAGVAAKAVVSDQVLQKNQTLGELTWLAMNVSDRADVRQWSTLPATFQILRLTLPPGIYEVHLRGQGRGLSSEEVSAPRQVQVLPGKIFFDSLRVF